jgi:hypothetical protein
MGNKTAPFKVAVDQVLTESEVQQFVHDWFRALDIHAPVNEVLTLLLDEGLEMRFPGISLYNHADFRRWYEGDEGEGIRGVIQTFFDEVHTLKELSIKPSGAGADVELVVNWQARIWNSPEPKSQWLGFDAPQRWVVRRSSDTGRLVISQYIVDPLIPMPGSARLL